MMFKAKEIGKVFRGITVLEDISFEIPDCEMIAIAGVSGVGKTTLLRILSGSVVPSTGCLCLDGLEVSGPGKTPHSELRRRTAMIYQSKNLVPSLSVLHNVLIGRLNRYSPVKALISMVAPWERNKGMKVLERVGLSHKLLLRADTLSGGEMQRVALARIILRDPEIFLADEPVSALDALSGDTLMQLMADLARELGKTLIVSTHNLAHIRKYFKRAIGLRQGRIMFDLPVKDLTEEIWNELNAETVFLPGARETLLPAGISKRSLCGTEMENTLQNKQNVRRQK